MSIVSIPRFHTDGRLKGAYVYMLLCCDGGPIYIKIGMSTSPTRRLDELRNACPIPPKWFAVAEVFSRERAKLVEAELLSILGKWRIQGEWFSFQKADKAEFNEAWKKVFNHFSTPSWRMRWTKIPLKGIKALAQQRKYFAQRRYMQRGKAYQDYLRASQ